jgi:peptide/nickel transport system ATP-binding protein
LDVTVQKQIIDLLKTLKARYRMSILFISHDLALVSQLVDRVIVMRDGRIREDGNVRQIFSSPKDRYTQALIQCRPTIEGAMYRLPVIEDFMSDSPEENNARLSRKRRKKPDMAQAPVLLQVDGLSKVFEKREGLWKKHKVTAVNNVSFQIKRGRTLGIVGESGSGKTTTAMMLLRLLQKDQGTSIFYGNDILNVSPKNFLPYRRRLQIVFQNPYASLNPRFTVGQSLLEPMLLHKIVSTEEEALKQALGWLNRVGLDESAFYKYPHEFSGGQRQRVALARALALHPEVLVLDEPVSALDVSIQAQILNLLRDIQDELGISYLFISHDLAVVRFLCDEVVVMKDGNVIESGLTESLFIHPQTEYTKQLLAAAPTIADSGYRTQ